jgi:2-methylisocitrate lyase-like PEP mutase family enzyme
MVDAVSGDLAALAGRLRALHSGADPLVLPNAWDGASARAVEQAGFAAVATSSGAVARMLGREDGEAMTSDEAFAAVAVVARSVSVPVTADMEAGYGLDGADFVERLLSAGAVGCNYEDTDHSAADALLVPVEVQAARLAAIKEAGHAAGVDIVLNARVDTFLHRVAEPLDEALARARRYVEAGADCVYPILAQDPEDIRALVAGIPAPVNVMLRPGSPSLAELQELGVRRVSMGSGLHRAAMDAVASALAGLR